MNASPDPRLDAGRYLRAIEENSVRFADVLAEADDTDRVPTCPDWNVGDLVHHLAQVQHFWALVVSTDTRTDAQVAELPPLPRASNWTDLLASAAGARGRLLEALRSADPQDETWTWSPTDRSVGFVLRRQAHEACMHRLDAELAARPDGGARSPVDPMLATDGVDEVLRMVAATTPPGADVEVEDGRVVRVVATDTATTWLVTMTRVVVTEGGRRIAAQGIHVADADPADGSVRPAAILSGTAEDLDCCLWGRPTLGDLHRTGDTTLLGEFDSVVRTTLTRASAS